MKRTVKIILWLVIIVAVLYVGSFLAVILWPQKDILPREVNNASLAEKVLIVSRSSAFKEAVVQKILDAVKEDSVYIKVIGMKQLHAEDGARYAAVVLINTCMAGRMDHFVTSFLKKNRNKTPPIILITAGDGKWLPRNKGNTFDALSSASNLDKSGEVAKTIVDKIRLHTGGKK
jgi:hypothetical protein